MATNKEKTATTRQAQPEKSAARRHAEQFLAPAVVDPTVYGVARKLIESARRDPELAKLFIAMQEELGDGRDLLDQQQSECLDRITTDDELDLPSAPGWLRPAIAAAYIRASQDISPKSAAEIINNPKKALRQGLKLAGATEPEFVGELIVESTLSLQRDKGFRDRLKAATDELRPIVEDLYTDEPATAIAKAAGSSSGGSCRACRAGRCEPISCWVIVVIIIVIIVVK